MTLMAFHTIMAHYFNVDTDQRIRYEIENGLMVVVSPSSFSGQL